MKHFYSLMILTSLTALVSQPFYAADNITQELEGAVNDGDILKVKKFLRKLDRMQIAPQEKKSTFAHLIGMTEDTLSAEKAATTVLSNRCDMVRFVGGALVSVFALSRVVGSLYALSKESCEKCKCIDCEKNCECGACGRNLYHCFCIANNRKITKSDDSTTRFMYALQGVPSVGILAGGLYQMYQGLKGASRESTIASAMNIKALLKETAGA